MHACRVKTRSDHFMPTISIPTSGLELKADTDDNLLKVLRRHEVPIHYSCKQGECGSCKCMLERGEVEIRGYKDSALPPSQRAQGLILACCSRLKGDVQLRLIDSDDYIVHPERQLVAEVIALRELAPEVFGLRLKIRDVDRDGEPFIFSAGQYVQLSVQTDADTRIARDFSMASTPVDAEYDDELEFHIRRTATGAFSGLLGNGIRLGSTMVVDGPMGSSHFRPRHQGPLYAVAAGTGFAPMLSIVKTALHNGKLEPVVFYAGFKTPAEVYGREDLALLQREFNNFRFDVVVEQDAGAGDRTGRVGDVLLHDVADFAGAKVYLAGSPGMVETVSACLLERGLPAADVHADAFYAPKTERTQALPAAQVVVDATAEKNRFSLPSPLQSEV